MFANKLVKIFYCCSDSTDDKAMQQKIEKHLSIMKWDGVIEQWHSDMISPGKEREREIDKHLKNADIILLLISREFIASHYHWEVLRKQAMKQHSKQVSRVILILLYPVDDYWRERIFPKVKVLPDNKKPITKRGLYDDAFTNIAKGIREVVEELSDPIYHAKKYVRLLRTAVIFFVKSVDDAFIYIVILTFSPFIKALKSRRQRKASKIFIRIVLVIILSGIFIFLISRQPNISKIYSSEPNFVPNSTQQVDPTGWILIGTVNNSPGSLSDGKELLRSTDINFLPNIYPPVLPSIGSVVTLKYQTNPSKEKSFSSQLPIELQPGEKLVILKVESLAKSSQNSQYIIVWAQVSKCNQTCEKR